MAINEIAMIEKRLLKIKSETDNKDLVTEINVILKHFYLVKKQLGDNAQDQKQVPFKINESFLTQLVETADEKNWNTDFLESIHEAYLKYGRLTEKQEAAVIKIADKLGVL